MRHGKKPTRKQREALSQNNINTRDYLYVGETDDGRRIIFRHRVTGKVRTVDKN